MIVRGVSLDSRRIAEGDLYAALPGSKVHGAVFTEQVVAAGAAAVLTDPAGQALLAASPEDAVRGLPRIVVPDPRGVLGTVSALVYGDLFATDRSPLQMLGVTGTNGKTTTTYLLEGAATAAGATTGLIGTVEIRVAGERVPSVRTTPESPDVHALLATMAERGVSVCAMEVSSHALTLHRVDGVIYDVAAFTNLSRDHLDFHADMEDYFAAKASLFTPARARRAVVCVDDAWGRRLARQASIPVTTVASCPDDEDAAREADWRVVHRVAEGASTAFVLERANGEQVAARSPLPGAFNVTNTAVALVVLVEAGWDPAAAATALGSAGHVPGRMEAVDGPDAPGRPIGIVDYAHTPQAVTAACSALDDAARPLVIVLGAGGDRDRAKRPEMGAAAAQGADIVVVTDDNPRSEDPSEIRAAVLAGAREHDAARAGRAVTIIEVPYRRLAIRKAVELAWGASSGDSGGTVLVAGKGHEQGQEVAGTVTPFDDRVVLREALEAAALSRGVPPVQPSGEHPPSPGGTAATADPAQHASPAPKETAP